MDKKHYKGNDDFCIAQFEYEAEKRLVVSYKESRARKDALERGKAIERLRKKLEKQKNPKEYLSNCGYKKYLKVRPIFHWTERRIKAHLAICFTAYALVRHLEYRVRMQYENLSIEKIRQSLIRVQTSILYHAKKKIRFALPSRISPDAKKIYRIMNLTRSLTPWIIK